MGVLHSLNGAVTIEIKTENLTQDLYDEIQELLEDEYFYSPEDSDFYYINGSEDFCFTAFHDSFDWTLDDDYIKNVKEKFMEDHVEMLKKLREMTEDFTIDYRIFDSVG